MLSSITMRMSLINMPVFGFASRMKVKRIYVEKQKLKVPEGGLNLGFPGKTGPSKVIINKTLVRARYTNQPTPIKDFINFKKMSGNELLLNLDNHDNFSSSELVSGLIELGKRDSK